MWVKDPLIHTVRRHVKRSLYRLFKVRLCIFCDFQVQTSNIIQDERRWEISAMACISLKAIFV